MGLKLVQLIGNKIWWYLLQLKMYVCFEEFTFGFSIFEWASSLWGTQSLNSCREVPVKQLFLLKIQEQYDWDLASLKLLPRNLNPERIDTTCKDGERSFVVAVMGLKVQCYSQDCSLSFSPNVHNILFSAW